MALAGANGTSGNENEAALLAKSMLEEYMPAHIDTLGSVCGDTGGDGVHIMLDAHIDRIGMTVTAIDDSGFIKFARVGGMDARVLAAEQVTVWGDKPLFGVITSTPPHLASGDDDKKAKKIDDLSIDVGMTADEVKKIVRPGMRITVNSTPKELLGGRVSCAALDDRAGVAAILRCLELLKDKNHGCRISVLFSSQEETGGSGAAAGGFAAAPDEAIAVDVSFAMAPGLKKEKCGKLGGGAMIGFLRWSWSCCTRFCMTMIGFSPSLDYSMSRTLERIADENGIARQCEIMSGSTGTNADEIQVAGSGVRMGLISIPQRNMHTAAEIVDLNDIEAVARLMAAYIIERGRA